MASARPRIRRCLCALPARRFSLDGGADATIAQADATEYVTTGTPLQCPAGAPNATAKMTQISSGMHYVAVTGGLQPAAITVEGLSLASFCAKKTASCIVGAWTTTRFHATIPGLLSEQGAAGAKMTVGPDGSVTVDFNPMAPIVFTGTGVQGVGPLTGEFTFGGQVTGQVQLPSSSGATTGTWRPPLGGKIYYGGLTVTVQLTSPISKTIGPLSVSQLAGSLGAGASSVNGHPLSGGTWYCSGNTLINRPPNGTPVDGTWTWQRTG